MAKYEYGLIVGIWHMTQIRGEFKGIAWSKGCCTRELVTEEYSELPLPPFAGQGINFRFRGGVKYNFLRQKESSKNPQNTDLQFLREPVKYYNLVLINSFSAKFGQRFFGPKTPFPFSIWRAPLIASKYLNCFPGKQVPPEQKLTRLQFAASAKTFCRSDLSKLSFVHHPITPPRHFSYINSVKMEKPRLSCLSFNHHHIEATQIREMPIFHILEDEV